MKSTIIERTASLSAHVKALKSRHRKLDGEIMEEQRRPAPDHVKLRWLKARRLVIRDQLARYEGILRTLKPMAGHALARGGMSA